MASDGRSPRRWVVAAGAAACLTLATAGARAAGGDDPARAAAIAAVAEAEKLIDQGKLDDAIAKYEEAAKHRDAPTVWLMVARLRVRTGQLVRAQGAYQRASGFSLDGAPKPWREAVDRARSELAQLGPRVPTLAVQVTGASEAELTVDEQPFARGEAVPIDPGQHRIVARAPGMQPASVTPTVAEGEHALVHVTLAPELGAPPPPPPPPPEEASLGAAPIAGIVTIGVGVAGLAVGAVLGAVSLSQVSELDEVCVPDRASCPPSEDGRIDDARLYGHVSTIALAVGGAAVAAGVVVLAVDAAGEDEKAEAARLELRVSPTGFASRIRF